MAETLRAQGWHSPLDTTTSKLAQGEGLFGGTDFLSAPENSSTSQGFRHPLTATALEC